MTREHHEVVRERFDVSRRSRNTRGRAQVLSRHIWVTWFALAAVLLSATKADPDLWGHTRFGLDWLHTRSLPTIDPYSFTQDRPWINHEWLSEAAMGLAYSAAGSLGLVLLKAAIVAAALFVLWKRLDDASVLMCVVILTAAIAGILPITLTVRPQLWSLLGLVLLIALMDRPHPPGRSVLVAGALLFAAWGNLHGGWITGAGVLCVYAAARIARTRKDVLRWTALIACCLAATVVNPYGIGLWRFLGDTVRPARPDIGEWLPMRLSDPISGWVPVLVTAGLGILLALRRDTRPPLESCAAILLLLAGSLRVNRVAPLMAPAALALLAPSLRRIKPLPEPSAPSREAALVLYLPVGVILISAAMNTAHAARCIPIRDGWAPDRIGAARLQGLSGRLLTTFDWGQYAIWHFGPGLRVSIDGRRETVYSDEIVQAHLAFERGEPSGQAMVGRIAPDYVWLPSRSRAARDWLAAHGYRVEFASDVSFIAVRQDLAPLPARSGALPPCFP